MNTIKNKIGNLVPETRNLPLQHYLLSAVALALLIILMTPGIQAGVTGKISGMVSDVASGEPVVGATVRVVGTNLVTQTDMDGEYFFINVSSGKYDLAVSSVGYEVFTTKDVRVLMDLTTPVDFKINQETVKLDVNLVVYAENPIIQKDLTGSKIIFTSDRLKTLPNITTVQSVLTNYPGVIVGKDRDLHVRGGRSGQISYYYDGFSVHDPFVANSGIHIVPNSLEELTLTSGGYSAEYGEALSGVVSAITKEGGSQYKGSARIYQGFTHKYDIYNANWSDLSTVKNHSGALQFSGPIPLFAGNHNNFSAAGEYKRDPGSLPHNESESYSGTVKLSFQPLQQLRVISNLSYYIEDGDTYEHRDQNGISYDLNLDGLPSYKKKSYLMGLSGNYHINKNFIFSTRFNRFYTYTKIAPKHLMDVYWDAWPGYSEDADGVYNGTIHEDNYRGDVDYNDPSQLVGFTTGDDFKPYFTERESEYNAFHASVVNQVNKSNEIKAGFEYRYYKVNWDQKQFYNEQPYGEKYNSKPVYISMFAQDKMEYDFFVINMGLRYDYRNDDITYLTNPLEADLGTEPVYESAEPSSKVSPRLGVSFPITEKSVMHFNYGLYYQVPRFVYMYTNLDGNISSGFPLLGNPNLKPERTTAYEIGLDHMLNDNLKVDVTAYYKNIDDLVTTASVFKVAGNNVTTFLNEAYGSVKGFDLHLEKLPGSGLVSGSISYSYMISKGNGSNTLEPYYSFLTDQEDTLAPITDYPLDFDQRHSVTGVLDIRASHDFKSEIAGIKVPTDWGLSFVGYYGSGLPYTLTNVNGDRLGYRNEGRLPAGYTVDMKFNKDFRFNRSSYMLSFFVEVDNLFDNRNTVDVYSLTGRPDNDGSRPIATLSLSQSEIDYYDSLYDHDPLNYSMPRTVRTGLELNF